MLVGLRGFVAFHREATPQTPASVLFALELHPFNCFLFCEVRMLWNWVPTRSYPEEAETMMSQPLLYYLSFFFKSGKSSCQEQKHLVLFSFSCPTKFPKIFFSSHKTFEQGEKHHQPSIFGAFLPFNPRQKTAPKPKNVEKFWMVFQALSYAIDRGKLKAVLALAEEWRGCLVGDWMIWRFRVCDVLDINFGEICRRFSVWWIGWSIDGWMDKMFHFVLFCSVLCVFCVPPSIRSFF